MRWLLSPAFIGAALLATLSVIADEAWFRNAQFRSVDAVVVRQAIVFACLGCYLGFRKGKAGVGALVGMLAGAVATAVFFLIARADGQVASFLLLYRDARVQTRFIAWLIASWPVLHVILKR